LLALPLDHLSKSGGKGSQFLVSLIERKYIHLVILPYWE
jgi:hypothetical protein